MACPRNRADMNGRKTIKYTTVRVGLRERHPDFKINQTNVFVDVLVGYSKGLREQLTTVLGKTAARRVLGPWKRLSCCMLKCVVEWTFSLFISFILCKINVCRLVCRYLICAYFIFFLCYPIITLKKWWKEFGSAPSFILRSSDMYKQITDKCQ